MQTIKDLGSYTFPALLKNSLSKFSDRIALSLVNGTPITYKELGGRAEKFGRLFEKLNLARNAKIAIYSTSSPNWGASFLGIVNYGRIAVPLLPDFNAVEVETILKHAEVSVLLVNKKMFSRIEHISSEIIPIVIDIEDFTFLRGEPCENFDDVKLPEITVKEEDTASIIYTSGTTGRSKGVELTHKNIVWNAVQCQGFHRVNKRDKCLSFLPLSHVYEFTIGFVLIMLNGASVYYLGKPPTVSALLPAFSKVRPTIVLSVPMVMEKIYKSKVLATFTKTEKIKKLYEKRFFQKIFHKLAGSKLKKTFGGKLVFFGIGGAKLDPVVEQFLKDAKFPYAIGYGLTETAPLLAGSGVRITKIGTIGPVVEGVDLKILNPDSKTGIGEVIVKGPNVMKGYYKAPELTADVFTTKEDAVGEGWFKTGDLGELDKTGRLSLKGRLKNMILGSSGENIYPEDIEFVLNQHPLVTESLVVEGQKGLVALVQLDDEKYQAASEEIIKKDKEAGTYSEKMKQILDSLGNKAKEIGGDFAYAQESILTEIQYFVNKQVNRFSQVGKVQKIEIFEKTASQKIKRYLYNLKKGIDTTLENFQNKDKEDLPLKENISEVSDTEKASKKENNDAKDA